jgi:organic hydroperoxide reductase OsmC/OhrA
MAEYRATVEWQAAGDFAANRYSRAHRWAFDGGAVVPASASPQAVPAPFSDPAGVDPEEALVAAISSCHMLWFLHLARDAGLAVDSYRDEAVGRLGKDDRGRIAITRVALRPRIAFAGAAPDAASLARLHEEAHARCYIANSLRGEVVVED